VVFLQFLKSLDDLLYELMSWLVFYPVTLWRAITRPLGTMAYADRELGETVERQYNDALSPPQFLLVTLLVSHALELSIVGQSEIVTRTTGLAGLVSDNTTLLLLRLLLFSLCPLVLAVHLTQRQRIRLTRETLRIPFYAQCYAAGPLALGLGIGTLVQDMPAGGWAKWAGMMMVIATLAWFAAVQWRWYGERLKVTGLRRLEVTAIGLLACLVTFVTVAFISSGT
jgi:hypothetical protein